MKQFKLTPFTLLLSATMLLSSLPRIANAQEEAWPQPSKESQAYSAYRQKMTLPPYGLSKVQALIKSIQDDNGNLELSDKAYHSLTLREQFTYNMIHGEAENQNCDAMPPITDEQKKIFSHLPDFLNDYDWSPRQKSFFTGNRDSVLALIRESTLRSGHIGVNYKQVVADLQATTLIPFIISTYRANTKDHDLLTVLLLLMSEAKYAPFLQTPMYKKLYGGGSDYRSFIQFNAANETLIINRAMDFYNSKKR